MTDHALRLTCKGKVCQYSCPYLDEYQYTYVYIYKCTDSPSNTTTNTSTDIDHLLNAQASTSITINITRLHSLIRICLNIQILTLINIDINIPTHIN